MQTLVAVQKWQMFPFEYAALVLTLAKQNTAFDSSRITYFLYVLQVICKRRCQSPSVHSWID